jgi:very-short-patch-repair endonuclease
MPPASGAHRWRMTWTAVARRQAGFITRRQLLAAGELSSTVARWLDGRRLERTGIDGVYRVAGAPETPQSAAWFAALSTRSPVSFLTAALWWEMPVPDDGLVHITRFDRRRLDWPTNVRIHRVAVTREAIVRRRGLWVTGQGDTALDCIGWLSPGRALTLADRALQNRWLHDADIYRRLHDQRGRWGNRQIHRILDIARDGADAESERRLHRLLRRAGVVGWTAHLPFVSAAGRFEIDVAFPEQRIAVEVDGYAYHHGDARFQTDRRKQNALMAAGWRVLRFTWADIIDRPQQVLTQIGALLAA